MDSPAKRRIVDELVVAATESVFTRPVRDLSLTESQALALVEDTALSYRMCFEDAWINSRIAQ